MFYNPFTLKTLGYIEPPELKSKILKFMVSPLGHYIGYQTSDYLFYLYALDLVNYNHGEAPKVAHRQE